MSQLLNSRQNGVVVRSGPRKPTRETKEQHVCDKPPVELLKPGTVWQCQCRKRYAVVIKTEGDLYQASYTGWQRRRWPFPRHKHTRERVTDWGTMQCTGCGKYMGNAYDIGPG